MTHMSHPLSWPVNPQSIRIQQSHFENRILLANWNSFLAFALSSYTRTPFLPVSTKKSEFSHHGGHWHNDHDNNTERARILALPEMQLFLWSATFPVKPPVYRTTVHSTVALSRSPFQQEVWLIGEDVYPCSPKLWGALT